MDIISKIIQAETEGFETEAEWIEFYQELVDTGIIKSLQGTYQKVAAHLIAAGKITPRSV